MNQEQQNDAILKLNYEISFAKSAGFLFAVSGLLLTINTLWISASINRFAFYFTICRALISISLFLLFFSVLLSLFIKLHSDLRYSIVSAKVLRVLAYTSLLSFVIMIIILAAQSIFLFFWIFDLSRAPS